MTSDAEAVVRVERAGDADAIRDIHRDAFGGPDEARIVDSLREVHDTISLVACIGDRVVGHILFSPVTIDPPAGVRAAGLAPMAVAPEWQRRGVGGQLVRAGLEACRRDGFGAVFVVGHPEYYPRFGFVPADTRGLQYEHTVPREAFMVIELEPGVLPARPGVVRFRSEFTAG